jgi:hypothetical protein
MKTSLSIHLKPPFGEQPFIGLGSLHSGGSLPELPEPAEPNAGEQLTNSRFSVYYYV